MNGKHKKTSSTADFFHKEIKGIPKYIKINLVEISGSKLWVQFPCSRFSDLPTATNTDFCLFMLHFQMSTYEAHLL